MKWTATEIIDAYNNFRVSGSGNNSMYNPAMSFNMDWKEWVYDEVLLNAMMSSPFWNGAYDPIWHGG